MVTIQQRGLGKGLSALISENYTKPQASIDPALPIRELPPASLVPGKYQPRSHFDSREIQELADSINRNGLMQPIVVRPLPEKAGKYEIVAGERRWRAAQIAKLETVPVIIRALTDKQALELALVENIQRKNLSPLEEATAYLRLTDEFSYSQDEIAESVGKSRSHIANLLRLLSLPDEVKHMLDTGEISMGHARALITSDNPAELARQIADAKLSVRAAEDLARTQAGAPRQTRPREPRSGSFTPASARRNHAQKDPDLIALEETLSENLGMQVRIDGDGQQGELAIRYTSLSQLDDILRHLGGGI